MIKLDGKEVKVGSKLFCLQNGWGTVKEIDSMLDYPIGIQQNTDFVFYTSNGELYLSEPRSLFWDDKGLKTEGESESEQDLDERATYLVLSMVHVDESEMTMPSRFIYARSDDHIFVDVPRDDFAMYYTCKDAPRSLIAPILYAYNKGFDMLVFERGEEPNEELPLYGES